MRVVCRLLNSVAALGGGCSGVFKFELSIHVPNTAPVEKKMTATNAV
jgi:hypothetical protein